MMTLLLVVLAAGQAWAEKTVDVPIYSPTQLENVPLDCGYGSWGYHSQMVYPQSLLQDAKLPNGAFITAITFYTWNGYPLVPKEPYEEEEEGGTENNPLTIKLGQPTDIHLYSFVDDGLTTVSESGNIWSGTNVARLEFDVDKAYRYTGGNLLIDMTWAKKTMDIKTLYCGKVILLLKQLRYTQIMIAMAVRRAQQKQITCLE